MWFNRVVFVHAIKPYRRSIIPLVPDFGTGCNYVTSFTHPALYSQCSLNWWVRSANVFNDFQN